MSIVACLAFLAGCAKEDTVVHKKESLATKATQAHLTIRFSTSGNMMNFCIPERDQYGLTRVAVTLHNVYIWPNATPAPDFGTGPIGWLFVAAQDIIAEGALSENAYIRLTTESYLDQNSISISGSGSYNYAWTITGVSIGTGSGTGGGDSGGDGDRGDTICRVNYPLPPSLHLSIKQYDFPV